MKPTTRRDSMSAVLPAAKLAVNIVASVGVSKVVGDFVKNNTTVITTADAVKVWAGRIVIGSLISTHASNHVNDHLDKAANWLSSRNKTVEEVPEVV
jgi:hypothetical protein